MQAERPKITGYACVPHEAVLPQHNELTEEKLDEEKFKSTLLNELQAEEHTMPALQEPFGISQVGVAHPLQDLKIEKSSIQTTSPFQSVVVPLKAPQLQISDEFYQMVSIYYSQEQARAETNRVLADNQRLAMASQEKLWREEEVFVPGMTKETPAGISPVLEIPGLEYTRMVFDKNLANTLKECLTKLHKLKFDDPVNHVFLSKLTLIKIDSHISDFLYFSNLFGPIQKDEPVTALDMRDLVYETEVIRLKQMLQILFFFENQARKAPLGLDQFITDIRRWIINLSSALLRRSTYDDHLFLLSQTLHSENIHKWGIPLIQFPKIREVFYGRQWSPQQRHFFCRMLHQLLSPRSNSTENMNLVPELLFANKSNPFILNEDDWIQLLKQFPTMDVINDIFPSQLGYGGDFSFDTQTEIEFEDAFRFSETLIIMLTSSLKWFFLFRHFTQRLVDLVVGILQRASTYVSNLILTLGSGDLALNARIKSRFDSLFSETFRQIYIQPTSSNVVQFLVNLRYETLSTSTAYQLFSFAFTSGEDPNLCSPEFLFDDWVLDQKGKIQKYRESLSTKLTGSAGHSIMLTLLKIATNQVDPNLSRIILCELFLFSYIQKSTSESGMYKAGRDWILELLNAPNKLFLMSDLLLLTSLYGHSFGIGWKHLWFKIPIPIFQLTERDCSVLCSMLSDPTNTNGSDCSRYIIEKLLWDSFTSEIQTNLLIGILGVYHTLMIKYKTSSAFTDLGKWLSSFLIQRDFRITHPRLSNDPSIAFMKEVLPPKSKIDLTLVPFLHSLFLVSTIGGSVTGFVDEGVPILYALNNLNCWDHTLKILSYCIPRLSVYDHAFELLTAQPQFYWDVLLPIIKSHSGEGLKEMLVDSIIRLSVVDFPFSLTVLNLWTDIFFSHPGWILSSCDPKRLEVLDTLIHLSHLLGDTLAYRTNKFEYYHKLDVEAQLKTRGWRETIVEGIFTGFKYMKQFVWGPTLPQEIPYLALETVLVEMSKENDDWIQTGKDLINATNLDAEKLKLTQRKWAFFKIVDVCLNPSTKKSHVTCLAWWNLFFYKYFTFVVDRERGTSGFFAHYFLEVIGVPFHVLSARLQLLSDPKNLQIEHHSGDQTHITLCGNYFKAMKTWIHFQLKPTSTIDHVLNDPIIHNPNYLRSLLEQSEPEFKNQLHTLFDFQGLLSNAHDLGTKAHGRNNKELMVTQVDLSQTFSSSSIRPPDVFFITKQKTDVELPVPPPALDIHATLLSPNIDHPKFLDEFAKDLTVFEKFVQHYHFCRKEAVTFDERFLQILPLLYENRQYPKHRAFSYPLNNGIREDDPRYRPGIVEVKQNITMIQKNSAVEVELATNRKSAQILNFKISAEFVFSCLKIQRKINQLYTAVKDKQTIEKGKAAFRLLVNTLKNDEIFRFPSSRCLDDSLVALGLAFFASDPISVQDLLLESPSLIPLLGVIFKPQVSFQQFCGLMKAVLKSKIQPKYKAMLVRQFDVSGWLACEPPKKDQDELLNLFCLKASSKKKELAEEKTELFNEARNGFAAIAFHQQNIGTAIQLVCRLSTSRIHLSRVWDALITYFEPAYEKNRVVLIPPILEWMSGCVGNVRSQLHHSNLYVGSNWAIYTPKYFNLIQNMFATWRRDTGNISTVETQFSLIKTVFSVWFDTINGKQAWDDVIGQKVIATNGLNCFVAVINGFHELNEQERKNNLIHGRLPLINLMADYIFKMFEEHPPYIQESLMTQFIFLPWIHYTPTQNSPSSWLQTIKKISPSPSSSNSQNHQFSFLIQIIPKITWNAPFIPDPSHQPNYYFDLIFFFIQIIQLIPTELRGGGTMGFMSFMDVVSENYRWWDFISPNSFDLYKFFPMIQDLTKSPKKTITNPKIPHMDSCSKFLRNIILTPLKMIRTTLLETPTYSPEGLFFLQNPTKNYIRFCLRNSTGTIHEVFSDLFDLVCYFILNTEAYPFQQIDNKAYSCLSSILCEFFDYYEEVDDTSAQIMDQLFLPFIQNHPYIAHVFLFALQLRSVHQVRTALIEICLLKDFELFGQWERILPMLVVPEAKKDKFIESVMKTNSLFSLLVWSATDVQTQPVLLSVVKEIEIKPSTESEWEIILIWEKAIAIYFWEALQNNNHQYLLELEFIAKDLIEKYSSDVVIGSAWKVPILGSVGGQNSTFSVPFRLISRALGVFILSQIQYSKNTPIGVKQSSNETSAPSTYSTNQIYHLTWLAKQPLYKEYDTVISELLQFINSHPLTNLHNFIVLCFTRICNNQNHVFWQTPLKTIQKIIGAEI